MFNLSGMQSTASSIFAGYASLAATMMLARSVANDVIPSPVRSYIQSAIYNLFFKATPLSSTLTIVIDEICGFTRNQVYDAAEIYLQTKIIPSTDRFKVNKTPRQKNISLAVETNGEVTDTFNNFTLKWNCVSVETKEGYFQKKFFELSFNKEFKQVVLDDYLPFVLAKAKDIKDRDKFVKLYTKDYPYDDEDGGSSGWGSINLDHPSTFETLAMDPDMKKMIVDDLDRFGRRRDYYKKVGKAWKRVYLLYGPPGTGKSSLIAAMANYLNFDIYDLELTSLYSNSELRRILVSTSNRSIVVIEDIDCSAEMHNREFENDHSNSKLTLSGLLNFIDGLWSSCGDERIIVFTTNHKDWVDPALLRPGRMDVHINMSYCTNHGFKILASNYLNNIDNHRLFNEIEDLIANVEVTPAEVAEELMRSEDADVVLVGVVNLLKRKKIEADEAKEKLEKVGEVKENGVEEESINGDEVEASKGMKLKMLSLEQRVRRNSRKRGRGRR